MRQAFHFINGILNFPGSSANWNGKAVTYTHINTSAKAEKIEYFCGVISRVLGQKERALKLSRTLSFYAGWENHLVGHSNGCDVILDMLRDYPNFPNLKHVHLVCAACDADFEKNGLNALLKSKRIEAVTVYVAGKDRALALAHTWPGFLLGYGTLGLHGAYNVATEVLDRVKIVWGAPWSDYGHSDCWAENNFDETMGNFLPANFRPVEC